MSFDSLTCPACGTLVRRYRNPIPTVDIVIEVAGGIVLIERKIRPLAGLCRAALWSMASRWNRRQAARLGKRQP